MTPSAPTGRRPPAYTRIQAIARGRGQICLAAVATFLVIVALLGAQMRANADPGLTPFAHATRLTAAVPGLLQTRSSGGPGGSSATSARVLTPGGTPLRTAASGIGSPVED